MLTPRQERAIEVLDDAGFPGASWWGPAGQTPSRIYLPKPQKNIKVYFTFISPSTLEGPTLCIDIKECRQPPPWFDGQRKQFGKVYREAYAKLLGLCEPGLEALFRNDIRYMDLADAYDLMPLGGKTFK